MTENEAVNLLAQAIFVATELALPILIVSLVVGVAISLVQAVTQVQEMTLTFVPKLARAMKRLEGYDVVVIDCPPSLGALTREALAASRLAVVVTTPSFFGAQGAERAIHEINEIRSSVNPDLRFAGIIVNRLREKTEEHRYRKRELIAIHGPGAVLKPSVPERVALQQAESTGEPISAVKSAGARDVAKVFDKQMARLLKMARDADASD